MLYFIFISFSRMPLTNAERQRKWREKKAKEIDQTEIRHKDNERRLQCRKIKKDKDADKIFRKKQAERKKSRHLFFLINFILINYISSFYYP